ncbi:MAG: hypothetical protein QNJ54_23465 [Prochloraceae cyanobacterium]|nr:hypothetical protein [Prochloraceae cyanobacterium]
MDTSCEPRQLDVTLLWISGVVPIFESGMLSNINILFQAEVKMVDKVRLSLNRPLPRDGLHG